MRADAVRRPSQLGGALALPVHLAGPRSAGGPDCWAQPAPRPGAVPGRRQVREHGWAGALRVGQDQPQWGRGCPRRPGARLLPFLCGAPAPRPCGSGTSAEGWLADSIKRARGVNVGDGEDLWVPLHQQKRAQQLP